METEGISKSGGLLDVGLELGLIGKSGSFFNYEGKPIAQGKEAAKLYFKDHPKIADEVDKKIREMVASGKKLPKEIGEEEKEE
jgi:recombination protein RecA